MTTRNFTFTLLLGAAAVGVPDTTWASTIYVLSNNTSSSGSAETAFGQIDTSTGAYTAIMILSGDLYNLAYNPVAGNFWTTSGGGSPELYTLSTSGTLSAPIGTVGAVMYGMAYRTATSTLFGYDYDGDKTLTINPATGAPTTLNSSGIFASSPVGGRYAIHADTLYMAARASGGRFGTVDQGTGVFSQIVADTISANMAIVSDGTALYGLVGNGGVGNQSLYSINPGTGASSYITSISGTGLGTYFHGAGFVPVPEPGAWALLAGLGLVSYAGCRRWQQRHGR